MDARTQSEREHAQRAMEEAKAAGERIKSSAGEMVEGGREAARRAASAWESAKNSVQEKAVTGARVTDRAIRDHPYESIGIAFGVGVLIGVLINRR